MGYICLWAAKFLLGCQVIEALVTRLYAVKLLNPEVKCICEEQLDVLFMRFVLLFLLHASEAQKKLRSSLFCFCTCFYQCF